MSCMTLVSNYGLVILFPGASQKKEFDISNFLVWHVTLHFLKIPTPRSTYLTAPGYFSEKQKLFLAMPMVKIYNLKLHHLTFY